MLIISFLNFALINVIGKAGAFKHCVYRREIKFKVNDVEQLKFHLNVLHVDLPRRRRELRVDQSVHKGKE